ncbi:hypothetical protein VP01_3654g1 [Puccinia sorghi]|uniref:Uncharacterized protein n=1 Tax=Puccinia sorghi TaxID=27349 RepID=A0A0L6UVA1_9BASI|nr:hypothetical protein VP01_3654g1 [Puccinia sorghi]
MTKHSRNWPKNHVHLAQLLIGHLMHKASSGRHSRLRAPPLPGVHYHTPIHYSHHIFEPPSGAASGRAARSNRPVWALLTVVPGCNLNQAFIILAPSPKTQLTESNDENRCPETATPPSTTAKLDRQARNDYSPSSPLRSDWRKLIEQYHFSGTEWHHFPGRLESPESQITFIGTCFILGIPRTKTNLFFAHVGRVHCAANWWSLDGSLAGACCMSTTGS